MQEVDSYLGNMGFRCNSRLLDKKAANLKAWNNDSKATGTATISRMSLQENICTAHSEFGR